MEMGAIIAAAAAIIGGLLNKGKDDEAQALRVSIAEQYGSEILPKLDSAVADHQGSTSLYGIQTDPSTRTAQMDALSKLQNEYETGGQSEGDLAALHEATNNAAGMAASQRAGAAQSAARRGMGNSGLSMALDAQASQDATNATANAGVQSQMAARQRALSALTSGASLAGSIRDTDYSQAAAAATAQDHINQFNAGQDARANYYNLNLPQQSFDNDMLRRNARANAVNGVAAGYERQGAAEAQAAAGVGNAALDYASGTTKKKNP